MQLNAGASGVTCQKLGEAEVMAGAGVKDILIATNVLGAAASGALAALQSRISLKVCADNTYSIKAYSDAARDAGRVLDVLVECPFDEALYSSASSHALSKALVTSRKKT